MPPAGFRPLAATVIKSSFDHTPAPQGGYPTAWSGNSAAARERSGGTLV